MSGKPGIAVLGAGAMGAKHAAIIAAADDLHLAGVGDPTDAGRDLAARLGSSHYLTLAELLASRPDGVLIATPNGLHLEHGLECIAAGIPVLVEKPIATDVAGAEKLVAAAEKAGVPLLAGHHRRHNPIMARAKAVIDDGRIGRIVALHAHIWLMKPEDYFAPEWRRKAGAGPILTNLVHDIDLLRYLCGDIASVQATASSAIRGHEVEDSAAILLRFRNGALGTLTVSDTAVAPWSWELTAAENPDYPATGQSCYQIAGTLGALEAPNLRLWKNPGKTGWHEPLEPHALDVTPDEPLLRQIRHFADVIRGRAKPLVSGADGLAAIEALDAITAAIKSGATYHLQDRPR